MEDSLARGIAIASLTATVFAALIGWLALRNQKKQHKETLAAAETRLEQEIGVLRESLDESRRQWEESGSSVVISGFRREHQRDRHLDEIEIQIGNSGRLVCHISHVRFTDTANISSLEPVSDLSLPMRLEPGQPLRVAKTIGGLARDHPWVAEPGWWDGLVVVVRTGDDRVFCWNPTRGMFYDGIYRAGPETGWQS